MHRRGRLDRRRTSTSIAVAGLFLAVLAGPATAAAAPAAAPAAPPPAAAPAAAPVPTVAVRTVKVDATGVREPGSTRPVPLDATLFLPRDASERHRVPAVLLGHGFGGTQAGVAGQARELAARGYAVLTWTARGFGGSGGRIHLDSPDFEVADARRLVDALAARPEVALDAPGDPVVGATGASYGGGVSLLLAARDRRVDAVAAVITWNDLRRSLIPNAVASSFASTPAGATPAPTPGVLKAAWTSVFFSGAGGRLTLGEDPRTSSGTAVEACGRFADDFCAGSTRLLAGGAPTLALDRLLAANSPSSVAARITAPTLLVQGQRDSLFDLAEADATARALAAAGTTVAVDWASGGHDVGLAGGPDGLADEQRLSGRAVAWFDSWLQRRGDPDLGFHVSSTSLDPAGAAVSWTLPGYPGLGGQAPLPLRRLAVPGAPVTITSPPRGSPSAVTAVPGLGPLAAAVGERDPAGQVAAFSSAPLTAPLNVLGAPRVRLRLTSTAADAVVFASLQVRLPSGETVVPRDLVAPVRVVAPAGRATDVDVALPALAAPVPAGATVGVRVAATDRGYAVPDDTRRYTVAVTSLEVPVLPEAEAARAGDGRLPGDEDSDPPGWSVPALVLTGLGGVVGVAALVGLAAAVARRRAGARRA